MPLNVGSVSYMSAPSITINLTFDKEGSMFQRVFVLHAHGWLVVNCPATKG